jgi:glycine/D-amino acid oxidase-like deaminating enzyme/nitrite reductase/ring-hydroxylating ferredoxin subunit
MLNSTHSIWNDASSFPDRMSLDRDLSVDVCIVGAGITGLTLAYLLAREGKNVAVVEGGRIAGGETRLTTAHLTTVLDTRYSELEKLHGENGIRLAAASHREAIDFIEQTINQERIPCNFERVNGYLFCPPQESTEILDLELAAVERAGLRNVTRLNRAPLACFDTGPCLAFPRQAQMHPLKYLQGLAACILADGGKIFRETHVNSIEGGEPARVETAAGHTIRASAVVVATHSPVNDRLVIHTKQAAHRTYVISARMPEGFVSPSLLWDTAQPYHYVRFQEDSMGCAIIVGGEDHKTGQADDADARWNRLETWAKERFPMMQPVESRWSGQILEPVDGLAYIGQNPMDKPNVYVATGMSGNGMTYGTLGALLIRDLIDRRGNDWAALYDPTRITLESAGEFAKEALNTAAQYTDWATDGNVSGSADIPPGTGAVVRRGLKKVAVYCDHAGRVHECLAVCPHLGGIVTWNHAEESWDCPCHGSRFDRFGKVINGPAITDLPPVAPQNDFDPTPLTITPAPVPHF